MTLRLIAASACLLSLASCAPDMSADRYRASQVGSVNRAVRGEIISIRIVTIDRSTGVGGAAGAGLGATAGASLGSNTGGSAAGAIAGAVIGGIAGAALERDGSKASAYEYVIRTDNGALITLVQTDGQYGAGARVIVLYGSPARIIADADNQPAINGGGK